MPGLNTLPSGTAAFIDANVFLEHLLRAHPACAVFFHRIRAGEVRGITSVIVVSEVRHRLLLTELVRRGVVAGAERALHVLRARPEWLSRLGACDEELNALLTLPMRLVSITPAQFRAAQRISRQERLLTNDALIVATMRAHRLTHLASNDRDFARVPGLTLWRP